MKSWWKAFQRQQHEVDRAFRAAAAPQPEAAPDLHQSIMRAVRASRPAASPRRSFAAVGWISGAVAASLALSATLLVSRHAAPPPVKLAVATDIAAAPGAALDLGAQMPALLVSPLTNELARVDQDLHTATRLLLDTLP